MTGTLDARALDLLFRDARTHNAWTDKPVPPALLQELWDVMKWGPTSANCSPLRIVFVTGKEAKEKLLPFLLPGNAAKTMAAPVTAILGYDLDFAAKMDRLFPHQPDAKNWFAAPVIRDATAFRNGSLQAAYFVIAARGLGLDCGPMSGFNQPGVDEAFFAGTNIKSNFLCNLGYGDPAGLFPRSPRLDFAEACSIV